MLKTVSNRSVLGEADISPLPNIRKSRYFLRPANKSPSAGIFFCLGRAEGEGINTRVGDARLQVTEQAAIEEFLRAPGEDSFRDLFLVVAPRVLGFFRAHGCDPQLSEDLAQEVMLTVYRQAGLLSQKDSFRSWLFRIVRNKAAANPPQWPKRSHRAVGTAGT